MGNNGKNNSYLPRIYFGLWERIGKNEKEMEIIGKNEKL